MAILLCSPSLWRFVRAWRSAGAAAVRASASGTLGPWAGTVIVRAPRDIVLSVESRTSLALICELGAETTFPGAWKQSLMTAFEDMQVPLARVSDETRAPPCFAPLTDDRFSAILAAVEFVCDTELHYRSDLRVVQRRLNEFPHDRPPDYAPMIAVRRLFGVRS